MSKPVEVFVDTGAMTIHYRDFDIEESVHGWEWTHVDYNTIGADEQGVGGRCDTMFEAIEAIIEWYGE